MTECRNVERLTKMARYVERLIIKAFYIHISSEFIINSRRRKQLNEKGAYKIRRGDELARRRGEGFERGVWPIR